MRLALFVAKYNRYALLGY